jgi:hypothetical protein
MSPTPTGPLLAGRAPILSHPSLDGDESWTDSVSLGQGGT